MARAVRLIAEKIGTDDFEIAFHLEDGVGYVFELRLPEFVRRKLIARQYAMNEAPFEEEDSFQLTVSAAGLGTRLRPLTLQTPKPLLPVRGKPLLTRAISQFQAEQITSVSVLVNFGEQAPASYFSEFMKWWRTQTHTSLVEQSQNSDYVGSLLEILFRADERYSIVIHGDKFLDFDPEILPDLLEQLKHELSNCAFLLVGKKAGSAGRKLSLRDGNFISSLFQGAGSSDESLIDFGSAFFVFDTQKMPIVFDPQQLKVINKFTHFFQFLLKHGIKGKIVELPDSVSWKNINTLGDYAEMIDLEGISAELAELPAAHELLAAHTSSVDPGCIFLPGEHLVGGRSGSVVQVVYPGRGQPLVRKSKFGVLPVDEAGQSEPQAHLIDRLLFGSENFIEPSSICAACGECVCSLGAFIQGISFDEVISRDIHAAHRIRQKVIAIMQNKGYFNQQLLSHSDKMWSKWFGNRTDLFGALEQYEKSGSPNKYLRNLNLAELVVEAATVLTDPTVVTPQGFFPRDLNPGNIIITSHNEIKVIDQTMMFGDPVIVPLKLVIGWRSLSEKLASQHMAQAVEEFNAYKREIDDLDRQMLEDFWKLYPNYKDLKKRFFAALLIRHVRGLMFLRNKYHNVENFEQVEQLMFEYISEASRHTHMTS